jgi:sialate O-acetylesterase
MKLLIALIFLLLSTACQSSSVVQTLKLHGIFRSNMVLQREKPLKIWGWAKAGSEVKVKLGEMSATTKADGDGGLWVITFAAQKADVKGRLLTVMANDKTIRMDNVLIGDVWVMNGQSNMAYALSGVYQKDFEASMAHLPLMRQIRINSGAESEHLEKDLKDEFINGKSEDKSWVVVTPESALNISAIGFIFGSRLQRGLQVPIGIIDNARGGASLESLVPRHKFADDPQAAKYLEWVDKRHNEFSEEDFLKAQMDKWQAAEEKYQLRVAENKKKGINKKIRRPRKPSGSIRTWSVPGRSPSDAAACYNGMFGVFKGLNIKGIAFHQGFNNSMMNTSCKPKFYRTLMKLMIDGWREDFQDPQLPVAVIGFCAGGKSQTRLNFEQHGFSTAAHIREAQRLSLDDIKDKANSVFIPSYDQRIPQLHTMKKKELGIRTARWALKTVYGKEDISWESAKLVSSISQDGKILLTFDKAVRPDDFGSEIEGFSIAGGNGVFYMAEAISPPTKDRTMANKQIFISSSLVKDPKSVRYAWARSPMGNLKVNGMPWQPLHSFRTDQVIYSPEVSHMDPDGNKKCSEAIKVLKQAAVDALKARIESLKISLK